MASSASSGQSSDPASAAGGDSQQGQSIDWVAAENSPEFRELMAKRRSFVIPATIFFFVWYFGFILLAGYAPEFMGTSIYEGFTVGYLIALTQFLMVWGLGAAYLRRSAATFDPLARRAAETAIEAGRRGGTSGGPPSADGGTRAAPGTAAAPGEGGAR
jgi:uncharacterized membrane protein (DUF485 family)